jgi:hypothetical protein
MRILSLNKLIILVTELYESELNIRYWGLIDHSWDGKQIVNLALLVYREGLHETNSCLAGNLSRLYYFNISINNSTFVHHKWWRMKTGNLSTVFLNFLAMFILSTYWVKVFSLADFEIQLTALDRPAVVLLFCWAIQRG